MRTRSTVIRCLRLLSVVVLVAGGFVSIVATGCSAECSEAPPPSPPPPPPPPQDAASELRTLGVVDVLPGTVERLSIKDIEDQTGATLGSVVSATSSDSGIQVGIGKNRTLNILGPVDSGRDVAFTIELGGGTGRVVVPARIVSQTPTLLSVESEADEDGTGGEPPRITLSGLPGGVITAATAATLQITVAPGAIDPTSAVMTVWLIAADNGVASRDVTTSFGLSGGVIKLNPGAVNAFLAGLSPTEISTLHFSLIDAAGKSLAFDVATLYGQASINLQLTDPAGSAAVLPAPAPFTMRGQKNGATHAFSTAGQITLSGIIPDVYVIQSADLTDDLSAFGSVVVPANAVTVNATLAVSRSSGASGIGPRLGTSSVGSPGRGVAATSVVVEETGAYLPRRPSSTSVAARAVSCNANGSSASVTAEDQNKDVSCKTTLAIPAGSTAVRAKVSVSSLEYPNYTKQRSQYNDSWRYSVAIPALGKSFVGAGVVNDSHYSAGAITPVAECLSVAELARTAPVPVSVDIQAINVGDSDLATGVSVSLEPCVAEIAVSRFTASATNSRGYSLFKSRIKSANEDRFFSVMDTNGTLPVFGFPVEIHYTPKDAVIQKVEMSYIGDNDQPLLIADVKSQAVIGNGVIKFADLRLPGVQSDQQTGKISVAVKLVGTILQNGANVAAATADTPPPVMSIEKVTKFFPLYDLAQQGVTAGARYSGRDEGLTTGDGWGRATTLSAMAAPAPLINDISGLHVARTYFVKVGNNACGQLAKSTDSGAVEKNLLCHGSHSDGAGVDVRYRTDTGSYEQAVTGSLSGFKGANGVTALVPLAIQELVADNPTGPSITRVKNWVAQNRAMIDGYIAKADFRKAYIGEGTLHALLKQGRLGPGGPQIPGIAAWSPTKPVSPLAGHDDHWHVQFK